MENTEPQLNLKKESIKNGLIMAVVSIVIFLTLNYAAPDLMGSTLIGIIQLLIGIALAVFFSLELRKKAGGYWTFSQALLHIFIMFLVSAGLVYFFTIAFGKFIDTTYPQRMSEIVSSKTEAMLKKIGMDDDKIQEAMEKQAEDLQKQFNPTPSQMVVGFGIQAIMYFVGALIFAAIFKKNQPLFAPVSENEQE